MLLSTAFVPVREINSNVPRDNFSEAELQQAAELILQAEGIINPLVLRPTSLESYEVIDGHFEFYAAAKAREIDPRKGEMIGAFIVTRENQEAIQAQIQALRKREFIEPIQPSASAGEVSLLAEIERLIDKKISFTINNISQSVDELSRKIDTILSQPPSPTTQPVVTNVPRKTSYKKMTVPQLKEEAKKRNIAIASKAKKDEIIKALEEAESKKIAEN